MVLVPSAVESNAYLKEKEKEKKKRTIIDYANDQLDERSSDSSSAANAIVVWQFAVVQVHLTRFKNREKKGGSTGNRSAGASSSHAGRSAFNGFARMERISTGISLSISPSR